MSYPVFGTIWLRILDLLGQLAPKFWIPVRNAG
jgi:hypothetical protein